MESKKVTSYLLYAVGEILLVVIGIIIAVQLNNWNEAKKQEARIEKIFLEIMDDLAVDIPRANEILQYFDRKDSLIEASLNEKLLPAHFRSDSAGSLTSLTLSARHFKIHDNGFKKLIATSDHLKEEDKILLDHLNDMYVYHKYEIDKFDDRLNQLTDANLDRMGVEKPWLHKLGRSEVTDEMIDYFLHDPFYKNELDIYRGSVIYSYCNWINTFTVSAIKAYRMIKGKVAPEEMFPDFIPSNQLPNGDLMAEKFLGTFRVSHSNVDNWLEGRFMSLEKLEDHFNFFLDQDRDPPYPMYLLNETTIYDGAGATIRWVDNNTLYYSSTYVDLILERIK